MAFKSKSKASALPLRLRGKNIVNVSVDDQDILYHNFLGILSNTSFPSPVVTSSLQEGVIVCKNAISNEGLNPSDLCVHFSFRKGVLTIEEIDARDDRTFAKWRIQPKGSIVNSTPVFDVESVYGEDKEREVVVTATVLAILNCISSATEDLLDFNIKFITDFSRETYTAHKKNGAKGKPQSMPFVTMTVTLPSSFEPMSVSSAPSSSPSVTWF